MGNFLGYLFYMKILEVYKQVLNEMLSPEEYHYANGGVIYDIIKGDQLNLSSALSGADAKGHKFFFLSLSRTGSFKLGYKRGQTNLVRIVFDGGKLNNNFKSIPIDYWGDKGSLNGGAGFEYEDRLISDKSVIQGINKYILRVEGIFDDERYYRNIQDVLNICKEKGIPCFIYGNEKDLRLKRNLINDKILGVELGDDERYVPSSKEYIDYEKIVALLMYNVKYFDNYDLFKNDFESYVTKNNLPELDAYRAYDNFRRLSYGDSDYLSSINADLHNYFKGGKSGPFRVHVNLLVKEMKKYGLRSLKQLIDLKVNGLKPKTKLDFTKKFCLWAFNPNQETNQLGGYIPVDNDKQLKYVHGLYFNVRRYGGHVREEDFSIIWDLENKGGTVGELLNYLLNTYSIEKASEIIHNSSWDNFDETYRYKLDKIAS